MKNFKSVLSILLLFVSTLLIAQSGINYQTVVRDASGELVANTSVSIEISIIADSAAGSAVYVETHTVTTNQFGLVTLSIGDGTPVSGSLGNVDLPNHDYYIGIGVDITGNTNFTPMGVSQLRAVPYAMYAFSSGTKPGVWDEVGGNVSYSDGNVGIGTVSPAFNLSVVDTGAVVLAIGNASSFNNSVEAGRLRFDESLTSSSLCGFEFHHDGSENTLSLFAGCSTGDTLIRFQRNSDVLIQNGLRVGSLTNPDNTLSVSGDADISGRLAIGVTTPDVDTYVQIEGNSSYESALLVGNGAGTLSYCTVNMPSTSTSSAGIFRVRENGQSKIIVDDASATYQLTVYGDALASGGTWTASDRNLKTDIETIDNALSGIMQLNPTSYNFDLTKKEFTYLDLPEEKQFGFLAQELKTVYPNIVRESIMLDENGKARPSELNTVNYSALVPVLVKGMQEQQAQIEELKKEIAELKAGN